MGAIPNTQNGGGRAIGVPGRGPDAKTSRQQFLYALVQIGVYRATLYLPSALAFSMPCAWRSRRCS